ncbi:MAG: hypothetical protein ABIJ41_05470 [Candidatus Omnitrophota bacterium]
MNAREMTLSRWLILFQVDKLILVLGVMFFMPFFVHLIPWLDANPLGAIFLPIFYAPLVAIIFYRPHVALLSALLTFSLLKERWKSILGLLSRIERILLTVPLIRKRPIIAPTLNRMLTGRPDLLMARALTFELALFVALCLFFNKKLKDFWGAGVLSYVIAKLFSNIIFAAGSVTLFSETLLSFGSKLILAAPGLIILLLIHFGAIKYAREGFRL